MGRRNLAALVASALWPGCWVAESWEKVHTLAGLQLLNARNYRHFSEHSSSSTICYRPVIIPVAWYHLHPAAHQVIDSYTTSIICSHQLFSYFSSPVQPDDSYRSAHALFSPLTLS
ncbi:hypothetical protein EJ05DRAFT_258831 [Pseudovirgaria hyperparasitica]|uniref:Secreted protein n=1 Tax=Pseudovirgaria hyperparasitica TaxID=470096 RepID=A0A6A6WEP8_9PEZI|nr:uncharacterized protein EJ05DRAFT_258831 [Pseudovirgaria hyperparasitica]KAF2761298.1 hypothetical protein EJ05DRAFT_258831 [Pseudovirgaria hyperparasitica]